MQNLLLIKLGGSVITDKRTPNSIQFKSITRLCREISRAWKSIGKNTDIIICSGGGSVSHPLAAKYKLQNGFSNQRGKLGLSLTSDAEIRMNRVIVSSLLKFNLPVFSFAPASFIIAENGKIQDFFINSVKTALDLGLIPVMYGDMILDKKLGCIAFSSEALLGLIVANLRSFYKDIKIVSCGITDGVYDQKGKTIPEITKENFTSVKEFISGSAGIDVTGGMLHKVEESLKIAEKFGIQTIIINGITPGSLAKAVLGRKIKSTVIK